MPSGKPCAPIYAEHTINWKGQAIVVRWCPEWLGGDTAHLEIVTPDRSPHPISETGYRSHFCPRELVEEAGGPEAFVIAWLEAKDDGRPVQLSLFQCGELNETGDPLNLVGRSFVMPRSSIGLRIPIKDCHHLIQQIIDR